MQLTKPRVMILVISSGLTALVIEGGMMAEPLKILLFVAGLYLTGGSANALNQYFEREIDRRMDRTRNRRPLPLNRLSPGMAVTFSILIGAAGTVLLWLAFNALTAIMALGTILFYSLFYTLYLKPRTEQNIVIGGVAGAMAPVGAWAAATGGTALTPWLLFTIIFLWTPAHFWALAVYCRDDYRRVGLPMYPVTKGLRPTLNGILVYTILLVVASLTPLLTVAGWFYGAVAVVLGVTAIYHAARMRIRFDEDGIRRFFLHSMYYLTALLAALVVDIVTGRL